MSNKTTKDVEKKGKGQPRSFKDEIEFYAKFTSYLEECTENEYFANVAGFCVFCDITRETFYKQKEYYSDTYKKIENALENRTLQDKNTTRSIFYLKNKHGYKDKQEVESTNVNLNADMSEEEARKVVENAKKEGLL